MPYGFNEDKSKFDLDDLDLAPSSVIALNSNTNIASIFIGKNKFVYIKSLKSLYQTLQNVNQGEDITQKSLQVAVGLVLSDYSVSICDTFDAVASRSYSVGEYVMVGSRLRQVTSPISSGQTIGNDNTVVVSVMSELVKAARITEGNIPINHGGSGQSGASFVEKDSQNNIATATSGCSIAMAQFAQWGKVGQIILGITCNSAKSFNDIIAYTDSNKRPIITTPLIQTNVQGVSCGLLADGAVQLKGSVSAGTTIYVSGTYILQNG